MRRVTLFVLAALLIALLVYRFAEKRKVEATLTIAQIQAEKGYPIEVGESSTGHFRMVNHYTGTVVGGKQSDVISSLSDTSISSSETVVASPIVMPSSSLIC